MSNQLQTSTYNGGYNLEGPTQDAPPSQSLKDKIYCKRNLVGAKVFSPTHDSVGRKSFKNVRFKGM
eukprot:scaffold345094_cov31-Attheya_sp.AAC.1